MVGGNASHGLAVTADNRRLVVDSRLNSAVYVEMREVMRIPVGQVPKRNITATLPY